MQAQTRPLPIISTTLLLVVIAAGMLMLVIPSLHAVERHGAKEANLAAQCAERPEYTLYSGHLDRWAFICYLPELGKWGISIVNSLGKQITSFPDKSALTISDVFRYLQNQGYDFAGEVP